MQFFILTIILYIFILLLIFTFFKCQSSEIKLNRSIFAAKFDLKFFIRLKCTLPVPLHCTALSSRQQQKHENLARSEVRAVQIARGCPQSMLPSRLSHDRKFALSIWSMKPPGRCVSIACSTVHTYFTIKSFPVQCGLKVMLRTPLER